MKQNKILLDLERLRFPNSGIATVFRNIARGLQEIKGLDVTFYCPKKEEANFTKEKYLRRAWHKFFSFWTKDYTLIHVSHQLSSYFHKKRKNQKKILTLHDLNFLYENHSQKKKNRIIKRVNKNIANADIIVCISEFVKEDLLKNKHLLDFPQNVSIEVIHNGIDFPDKKNAIQPLLFPQLENKEYILNIGVLFPKKNQMSIVKMLPYISEDLVLVVSGSKSSYEKRLKEYIEEHKLENRVHILRNITNDEKNSLLINCKAMVHPSLAEGFGIPPIEAMFYGKPVFLSKLTSLPEIGGEVAYYFDTFETDAMVKLYSKEMADFSENKEKKKEELIAWAMQFDYLKMAEKYHSLYERTINSL